MEIKHVAVLATCALGDLLLALPLVLQCRTTYPGARITLVCPYGAVAEFAKELGAADDVVLLPARVRKSPRDLCASSILMWKLAPDVFLQPFASHGTVGNILAGASNARIRCGYLSGRLQSLLTHQIPKDPDIHQITSNLNLLRRLGHKDVAEPTGRYLPQIEEGSASYSGGRATVKFGRFAVISTGTNPSLTFKKWPTENWSALCRLLFHDGLTPVFVGAASVRDEVDVVISAAGGSGFNLAGETSFKDLAALIDASSMVIGCDGMILHFASAMNKACVGIFGPTSPHLVGPRGDIHENVFLSLPCSPCYGGRFHTRGGCATRECLNLISINHVHQKVKSLLGRSYGLTMSTYNSNLKVVAPAHSESIH